MALKEIELTKTPSPADTTMELPAIMETVKDAEKDAKLATMLSTMSQQEKKLLKAVAHANPEYVTSNRRIDNADPAWSIDADDVNLFVEKALSDPASLGDSEDNMLAKISRETGKFPDDYKVLGRRARYRGARVSLNEKANTLFDAKLDIKPEEMELREKQKAARIGFQ